MVNQHKATSHPARHTGLRPEGKRGPTYFSRSDRRWVPPSSDVRQGLKLVKCCSIGTHFERSDLIRLRAFVRFAPSQLDAFNFPSGLFTRTERRRIV